METVRQRLRDYLRGGHRGLREISQELRISEKEAIDHLEHLARSKADGERLTLVPARCISCGYIFSKRRRMGRPGRCPVCRAEHIVGPLYTIISPGRP
jgi:predicted Zn-ribbon and HTH transcriptional regulator